MGGVATNPVTIAEFDKLRLPEDRKWELRGGEVVELPHAKIIHRRMQLRLADLLRQAFPQADVLVEYPFQIEETNDDRSADIAMTTKERAQASADRGVLSGAPELVAEVLSPSNSMADMRRDRRVFFAHGTLVYLVVDPNDSAIEVYLRHEKSARILTVEDHLTLSLFGEEKTIPVAAIFAGITVAES
jgi:Uma2 family endonuclease